ncbi:hypothetical protein D3C79_33500 [compost metagenome]
MSNMRQLRLVDELRSELKHTIVGFLDKDESGVEKNLFVTASIPFISFDQKMSSMEASDLLDEASMGDGIAAYDLISKKVVELYPSLFHGVVMHVATIGPEEEDDREEYDDFDDELDDEACVKAPHDQADQEQDDAPYQEVEGYLVLNGDVMPKWIHKSDKSELSAENQLVLPVLIYQGQEQVEDIVLLANYLEGAPK